MSCLDLCEPRSGEVGYLGRSETSDGVWRPGTGAALRDYESAAELGDLVIRGRVSSGGDFRRCQMEYGIESYFVPEGTGHRIERHAGDLRVRVSVGGDGAAVIEDLVLPES